MFSKLWFEVVPKNSKVVLILYYSIQFENIPPHGFLSLYMWSAANFSQSLIWKI